ncbi:MAG: ABC transporter permease [Actinobacteria bacterium]|nr:ABC transporter permease [Actinomycetota bacterium]
MRALRLILTGWRFHVKSLTLSAFFLLTSAIQPILFATMAYFMFRAGSTEQSLLYVALGSGLMGIWSSTLFGSGGAISWQRWQGTLEVSIAAPAPFVLVLIPITLATATIGLYSLTATLLWGKLFFGVPFDLEHPLLFLLSIPATIVGLGMLGLVLAASFVLYRNANAMSNLLEFPVWLVTGLLVPLSLFPGWVEPISWVLAPTWGVRAIRDAALGGGDPVGAILMSLGLAVVYLGIGTVLIGYFERLARERATLSLT